MIAALEYDLPLFDPADAAPGDFVEFGLQLVELLCGACKFRLIVFDGQGSGGLRESLADFVHHAGGNAEGVQTQAVAFPEGLRAVLEELSDFVGVDARSWRREEEFVGGESLVFEAGVGLGGDRPHGESQWVFEDEGFKVDRVNCVQRGDVQRGEAASCGYG